MGLYRRHSPGLAATYADLENHVLAQESVLIGTPGSVSLRSNAAGVRFWVRQYYDFERRKRDQYVVAYDAPEAEARLQALKRQIDEAQMLLGSVRLLAREGYLTVTPRHFATVAALANHGLFRGGGILAGAHAYEVIVNRLGIRAESFPTEDVDIARGARIALPAAPEGGLRAILRESGVDFAEIPYAPFLLGETQMGAVLSSHGAVGVRVPTPERFALHKLIVSRLRRSGSEKSQKDLRQAAVLVAAVGELFPGALAEAHAHTAVSTRSLIRKSLEMIREPLQAHPQAWEEIASSAKV